MLTRPQLQLFYVRLGRRLRRGAWRLGLMQVGAARLLLGVSVLWAALALVHAWAELEREPDSPAQVTPLASELLAWPWQVSASAPVSTVHAGDTLTVTLRLDAPGQRPALELRAMPLVGLEPVDECWGASGPDCAPGRPRAGEWPRALAEGRTAVLLVGRLRVIGAPGPRALRWRVAVSGGTQARDLLLGPVAVLPKPARWLSLERTIYATMRDLLWPGLAAFMGFLLQGFLQHRSERQQVWAVIFPKAWANAQKHLIGLVSSAEGMSDLLGQRLEPGAPAWSAAARRAWATSDDGRGALYFALAMGQAMHRTRRQGGSLFLGSVPAEELVKQCWALFWRRLRLCLGREHVLPLLERSALWKSRVSFDNGLSVGERSTLEAGFVSWIADARLALDLALVRALAAVLQFEVDAMCGAWYGAQPQPPLAELTVLTRELQSAQTLNEDERTALGAALKGYRAQLEPRGYFDL